MKIARDKWAHFFAGMTSGIFGIVLGAFFTQSVGLLILITMSLTVLGGAAKELIYDKKHGTPDWIDFWFTFFGGVFISLLLLITLL